MCVFLLKTYIESKISELKFCKIKKELQTKLKNFIGHIYKLGVQGNYANSKKAFFTHLKREREKALFRITQ